MHPTDTPESIERLIRLPELQRITGASRTRVYELIHEGALPAPIKDGRASLWPMSAAQGYVRAKIAEAAK